jgi:hypothetical protein
MISETTTNDVETWRDLVSWLAQTIGCFATADREGNIVFRSFNQTVVDTIDDAHRFTGGSFSDYVTRYTGLSGAGRGIEAGISDDVSARVNLIYMIASKSVLINKAIGQPNAFFVWSTLIRNLKKENPANFSELQTVLIQNGGQKVLRGIIFFSTKVLFAGFPENRAEDELAAYRDFATGMVKASEKAAWVKADPVKTANERYTFRSWMNSIGMGGKEHADTRLILLQRLSGNTAFRTEEQREKALSVRRKKKEQEKVMNLRRKNKEVEKHEPATETDFVILGSCDRHSPHGTP